ncbi:MAG TPA: LTA synthase family protein [Clostridiales bacterium]|nr:LTA synthase family protein [Clostridiales bacterium]
MKQKLLNLYHKYSCVFILAILLIWAKTYISYLIDFDLGVKGWYQHLILFVNPIAGTLFFMSLSLFARNAKTGHRIIALIHILSTLLLYANILYYREFADFLTYSTMTEAKSIFVGGSNFINGVVSLLKWHDLLYLIDIPCLLLLIRKKDSKLAEADEKLFFSKPCGRKALVCSIIIFLVNLVLAEISRPMLLTRTFDRNYIVKYLGINAFTVYDSIQTIKTEIFAETPDKEDIKEVTAYASNRYASPDKSFFGAARGRNLIVIHMESLQQFLIDYKYTDENGKEWEVLPFLNRLYHSKDSISFANLFTQIGQGKSSDAELMVETSLFGLPRGAAFIKQANNTYYASPQILRSLAGYTSAAFHGNSGSFWNRNDMYKSLGYDYFFDANDFILTEENTTEYGLKDKLFFQQSVQYLEQLQQPFYAKFVTLSNHFPFPYDENNDSFPLGNTPDDSINGYFATSNYTDQALEEFFNYLKASHIYENSIIVLYGDHFGISDYRNKTLAPLLSRDPDTWTEFDDAQMKRVPFIIHIPGLGEGYINETFGGQIDILPTVLHLLGIDTQSQILMGQDLLSPGREEIVVFRNGDIISPKYTYIGDRIYDTRTGELVPDDENVHNMAAEMKQKALQQLYISDLILETDLLKYCRPKGLVPVNPDKFDYSIDPKRLMDEADRLGTKNSSVYYRNNRKSTVILYHTDAPEQKSTTENNNKSVNN